MKHTRIWIRIPNVSQKRISFVILKDGVVFSDARIRGVNRLLASQALDYNAAHVKIKTIAQELRAEEERALENPFAQCPANEEVFARAVKDYRSRDIKQRSRQVAIGGIRRAIKLLGPTDISTAPIASLVKLVKGQRIESRPKLIIYLNVLLGASGRLDRLEVAKKRQCWVKFLTLQELIALIAALKPEHRLPVLVSFCTGARLGEVFALGRIGRNRSVSIDQQLFRCANDAGEWYGLPKWDKVRWAPIIGYGVGFVNEWLTWLLGASEEEKRARRNLPWNEIVRAGCVSAFSGRINKHLTFRDVRHCYATYWLDKGASIHHVAQSMGNTDGVVRDHYAGFVQTDEGETIMLSLEKEEE